MKDRDFTIKEGEWFPVMNQMAEKLMTFRLSGTEWQVLIMFMRRCYGYQKSSCNLRWSDMKNMTGLTDGTLQKAIRKLKEKNIINTFLQESKNTVRYKINSKLNTWKTLSYRKDFPKGKQSLSYRKVNTFQKESTPIKENIKEKRNNIREKNSKKGYDDQIYNFKFSNNPVLQSCWDIFSNPGCTEKDFESHCRGYKLDPEKVKLQFKKEVKL